MAVRVLAFGCPCSSVRVLPVLLLADKTIGLNSVR